MSSITITLAIHAAPEGGKAILASTDGEEARAKWLPRSLIFDREGKGETQAVRRDGQITRVALVEITLPEWKAEELGWV